MLTPDAKTKLNRAIYGSLAVSVIVGGFYIFACWLSVAPNGGDAILSIASLLIGVFGIAMLGVFLLIPVQIFILLLKKTASAEKVGLKCSRLNLACSAIVLIIFTVVGFVTLRTGDAIRDSAFKVIAVNGEPVVKAIRRFEVAKGSPPQSLNDLVPNFIPSVPTTGFAAYPQYEYVQAQSASNHYQNSWALYVPVNSDGLGRDCLTFFPTQVYPKFNCGNFTTSVGRWAVILVQKDSDILEKGESNSR